MRLGRRVLRWLEDRTGVGHLAGQAMRHPVPPGVSSVRHGWWYVFGVGTLVALVVQGVTGLALATMYIPSTEHAYASLEYITNTATLGRFLRGLHYIGASFMIVLVALHMARVFLTGSYRFPREMNWLSGTVLLALTILLTFTGQLLRWDSDSLGSVLVAAEYAGRVPLVGEFLARNILAGGTITGTTLSRFYALHVFILPGLLLADLGLHLFLVLRNGISEPPTAGVQTDPATYRGAYQRLLDEHGQPYFPNAAWREVVFGSIVLAMIVVLAVVVGPRPLGQPPDPTLIDVTPRPDWYFVWYQAYLETLPQPLSDIAVVLTPLLLGAILLALPFIPGRFERAPSRRPWAVGAVALTAIVISVFLVTGYRANYVPAFDVAPVSAEALDLDSSEAATGAELFYARGCQYCHALGGTGGAYGPALDSVATRLDEGELAVVILRGQRDMPAYLDRLTSAELDALIALLNEVAGP